MKSFLLRLTALIFFGIGLTGSSASGGLIIYPEPVVIGNPPQKVKYKHRKRHARIGRKHHMNISPGHMPPPGKCRLWYTDRPPGHQPPPVSCHRIKHRIPYGAVLIRG